MNIGLNRRVLAIAFTNLVRNAIDIERHGVQNSARLNALHGFLRVPFRHGVEHVVDRVVVQIERLAIDVGFFRQSAYGDFCRSRFSG